MTGGWRLTRSPFGRLAMRWRRKALEVAHVKAATGEPSRAGEAGASAPMSSALPAGGRLRLAPLVPEAEIVSAIVARLVRDCEAEHEWETMDETDVTVCGRLNGARAAS